MTQIIGVVTPRSVLLAADRRLTSIATGAVIHDDTCKIVNLCNTAGIAYTGLAVIDGLPTHEWLCHRLADSNAMRAAQALPVIAEAASRSFSKLPSHQLYPHTFLLAGFESCKEGGVRPMLALITNVRDGAGKLLVAPAPTFLVFPYVKPPEQRIYSTAAGALLPDDRHAALIRNMGRAYSRATTDETLLRLMTEAILATARKPTSIVGERVLTMAIPLRSVITKQPMSVMLAAPAAGEVASFGYIAPAGGKVLQYGPSFVCGDRAFTDVVTENDPTRDFQSSSIRILRLPPKRGPTA